MTAAISGGGTEESDDISNTSMPPPSMPTTNGNICPTIETDIEVISSSAKTPSKGACNNISVAHTDNIVSSSGGRGSSVGGAADGSSEVASSGSSYIKASLSMTSLPPDEKRECREVIKAKLRTERPYNSLKKKCKTEKESWRNSWGSGYSHSSCSLHSNAASAASGGLFGIGCGKDEFWDALQTNYNYIMDTNLLDTCKEARCEIEGAASVLASPIECCLKMLKTTRPEGSFENPKDLKKWLKEMENKLEKAPTLSEATVLSISELKNHLAEHSVIYREIVSHARVVAACIRAAEKLNKNSTSIDQLTEDKSFDSYSSITTVITRSDRAEADETNSTSSDDNKIDDDGDLKLLEHQYHLLYLRAIEVQCLFEGLLGKKENVFNKDSSSGSQGSDDEPVNKHARISDYELESDLTDNSSPADHLRKNYQKKLLANEKCVESIKKKANCDDSYDEAEDEDEVDHYHHQNIHYHHRQLHRAWPKLNFNSVLLNSNLRGYKFSKGTGTTLTDFEADSEGSDYEVVKQLYHRPRKTNNIKQETKFTIGEGVYCMQQSPAFSSTFTPSRTQSAKNCTHSENFSNKKAAAINNDFYHLVRTVIPNNAGSIYHTNTCNHNSTITNNNVCSKIRTHSNEESSSMMNFCGTFTIADKIKSMTATTTTAMNFSDLIETAASKASVVAASVSNPLSMQSKQMIIEANLYSNQEHSSSLITQNEDKQFQKLQKSVTSEYQNSVMTTTTALALQQIATNQIIKAGGVSDAASGCAMSATTGAATGAAGHCGSVRRRQRHANDISKFNRSNRSSKNCAIFYFKHLDTDNETNFDGLSSSQGSDVLKSPDASSDYDDDDEEWLYTNTVTSADDHCMNNPVADEIQLATATTTPEGLAEVIAAIQHNQHNHQQHMQLPTSMLTNDDSDKENKQTVVAISSTVIEATETTAGATIEKTIHNRQNSSSSSSLNSSQCAATEIQMNSSTISNHSNGRTGEDAAVDPLAHRNATVLNGIVKVIEFHDTNGYRHSCHQQHRDSVDNVRYRSQIEIQNVDHPQVHTNHTNSLLRRLPPRSPNKQQQNFPTFPTKGISHESIKQLVLEAEHLVRDEANKTPTKKPHHLVKISSTVKKREVNMPGPTNQKVQEWLEHQPTKPIDNLHVSVPTTDCEASGEASETDSLPPPVSDSSEGLTDSIATCMQTGSNSYGNSTELIGGSAEPISHIGTSGSAGGCSAGGGGGSNHSLNASIKVIRRQQSRRKADRPWSVSCLSQLTESVNAQRQKNENNVQAGLASHSISESALDSLSPGRQRTSSTAATAVQQQTIANKNSDMKGSLKRRKTRKKKYSSVGGGGSVTLNGILTASCSKRSDSGSDVGVSPIGCSLTNNSTATAPVEVLPKLLMKSCETMSSSAIQEITAALLNLQKTATDQQRDHSEEEQNLMKPNFRVGSYTTAYMTNESRLGSLAALATYMNDEDQQGEYTTGTEDHHSSFSETAWDNYQEKYNSENYSEGFDSDAARRLMEFGDDYRNFIDSQSDCCSSLSAANNLDSFSPPRMDSLQQNDTKLITQDTIVSSVDHARRRRALELEYERRRKNLEIRRKSCQENVDNSKSRSPSHSLSASVTALTPKNIDKLAFQQQKQEFTNRKLDFGMNLSSQSLRKTSESDTSSRRRKVDERRRSSRNLEKSIKLIAATSSSSSDDTDDEKEMRNLLTQSRNRLEDTKSLKIRCHLLRPEDYTEIISTCRDNIRCLESVLRGPSSSVLSAQCMNETKDLLSSWDDLLVWSENASVARKMQEELIVLKNALNRLGNKSAHELLETEPSIQIAIEALKTEKSQLQTYRTSMLRLNASVHSWLTRQERKLQATLAEQQQQQRIKEEILAQSRDQMKKAEHDEEQQEEEEETLKWHEQLQSLPMIVTVTDNNGNQVQTTTTTNFIDEEKTSQINTIVHSESEFHKHLKDEVSNMYRAWDEADARINSQLEVLTTSLIAWRQLECGLSEFHLALGKDRGTLKGLQGALDKGQATSVEMAQNVKLVAKLLSEKVDVSQEQLAAVQENLDPNRVLHIAQFTASNGSLSDSGISDGGTTSDGGLSERERRLGVLRRLVKQLESALAPGSEAMKSIAARMESAESELKNLQNTCRDLIVRTAATHSNLKAQNEIVENGSGVLMSSSSVAGKQQTSNSPTTKRRHKRNNCDGNPARKNSSESDGPVERTTAERAILTASNCTIAPDSGDPDDDGDGDGELELKSCDDDDVKLPKSGWAWRIAKVAVPMQLALVTLLCVACLMQPNCCDNLNNFSMSFTPQLRYIRGPPPI